MMMSPEAGSYCSNAFAVKTRYSREGMLSAHHCLNGGSWATWSTPNEGHHVGTWVSGENPASYRHDAFVMTREAYDPSVFYGPWTTSQRRDINGSKSPVVGEYYCTSGAASGTDCNQNVRLIDQQIIWYEGGAPVGPGFWLKQENGTASVGQGDSGGPVVDVRPSGKTLAVGLISGLDGRSRYLGACQGWIFPDRQCGSRSFHVNIERILSDLNLTLQTR